MANGVIFTTDGREKFNDYCTPGVGGLPTNFYMGWGTGTNTPAVGDTALQSEATEARVTTTNTQALATYTEYEGVITGNGTKTITEAGLFDASTSGNLIARMVFTGISIVSGRKGRMAFYFDWS